MIDDGVLRQALGVWIGVVLGLVTWWCFEMAGRAWIVGRAWYRWKVHGKRSAKL